MLADTIRKAHVQSYFTVTFRFFQIQFGNRDPGKIADLPHFFVLSNLPNGRDSAAIWQMFCRRVELPPWLEHRNVFFFFNRVLEFHS